MVKPWVQLTVSWVRSDTGKFREYPPGGTGCRMTAVAALSFKTRPGLSGVAQHSSCMHKPTSRLPRFAPCHPRVTLCLRQHGLE